LGKNDLLYNCLNSKLSEMISNIMVPFPSDSASVPDDAIEKNEGESVSISPFSNMARSPGKLKIPIPVVLAIILLGGCVVIAIVVSVFWKVFGIGRLWTTTLTPTPTLTSTPTETAIPLPVYTITPWPTFTFTPTPSSTFTLTPSLTPTKSPFMTVTDTLRPTHWPTATFKPVTSKTPTAVKVACACSHDLYDCKDFDTHAEAQACYNYCVYAGWGDAHHLDKGGDGIVCKGLP
jgi:hypothetical protein